MKYPGVIFTRFQERAAYVEERAAYVEVRAPIIFEEVDFPASKDAYCWYELSKY